MFSNLRSTCFSVFALAAFALDATALAHEPAHEAAPAVESSDVMMQARLVPNFKDGQQTGWRLFSIRPDSVYTKMGLRNGDVVRLREDKAEPAAAPAQTVQSRLASGELQKISEVLFKNEPEKLVVERDGAVIQLPGTRQQSAPK